ncbi:uncharacterized protein A1O5_05709 [Cladophialophora psammophila CBS 110553]|uniref:Uncharacterized protein n=1 Tax=Cladophialophora psammophila CBS 110553 TaxID=1182543 RepID=W9XK22_9EURO|nr:uncharacterized protein A1O5_05709 [Cladophialophora psammophila CBS 110553]EXJ70719.1 hypothetical protein A1O5_05709 [Cladophialophora psammophila CBS 110553]
MSSTLGDYQLANAAAGFSLGFGFLTTWEAIKQTRHLINPWRSVYIFMVWGELIANLAITILVWLFMNHYLFANVPTYFFVLFFWAFEIHFILQLIINRLSVVVSDRITATRVKWAVAVIITLVNIGVFSIFIPAHLNPPPDKLFVVVNKYWDKATKFIILFIDAGLNLYFLHTVNARLVRNVGLTKYRSLVSFNIKLMVVSVLMDCMIIGMMFFHNQLVFMSFHPVAYTVKLNIELSMANLIRKIATSRENDFQGDHLHSYSMHSVGGQSPATLSRSRANTFRTRRTSSIGGVQASDDPKSRKLSDDERRIVVTDEYEMCPV